MSIIAAIILGIIQGATEFLPVSSSGHLGIISRLFGIDTGMGVLFEVLLHLGTLAAVCIVFWKDVKNLLVNGFGIIADVFRNFIIWIKRTFAHSDEQYYRIIYSAYRKFAALIIVTCIPTAIIGAIISKLMKNYVNTLIVPGIWLIMTALILLFIDGEEGGEKKVKGTSFLDAAIIGVAQGFAVLPGLSRSGSTIAAGLLRGMKKTFVLKYSFLASVPAIVGANLLELITADKSGITGTYVIGSLLGMVAAGVVGYFCIKWMMKLVRESRYRYFAYYCFGLGAIAIIAYMIMGN